MAASIELLLPLDGALANTLYVVTLAPSFLLQLADALSPIFQVLLKFTKPVVVGEVRRQGYK